MTTTTYTVKAIIKGEVQNLWTGYTKQEAKRVSSNYNQTISWGGDTSWVWNNEAELIIR